jgi:ketosteroid isomerase-like protein
MRKPLSLVVLAIFSFGACKSREEPRMTKMPDVNQAVAALRDAYAAFNRGDMDAAVASLDENIEWVEPKEFPGGGAYHGRESAKQYLAQSRAAWAEVSSEPEQFIPAGNRIVVLVHARVRAKVRAKDSEEWQDVRLADVYTFRDGKAIQMRAFADRDEALRWAGVQVAAPAS